MNDRKKEKEKGNNMNFEDYPLVPNDVSGLGYRIVGHIGSYPVYSHGVNPWRESALGGY